MNDYAPETLHQLADEAAGRRLTPIECLAIYAHVNTWKTQLAASQERVRELEARAAALRQVASDAYRDERTGNARVWRTGGLVLDTTPEEYVEHLVMNNRAPEPPGEDTLTRPDVTWEELGRGFIEAAWEEGT